MNVCPTPQSAASRQEPPPPPGADSRTFWLTAGAIAVVLVAFVSWATVNPAQPQAAARAMLRATGLDDAAISKPFVAVVHTWSDVSPCNITLRELAQHVRAGVQENGGTPIEEVGSGTLEYEGRESSRYFFDRSTVFFTTLPRCRGVPPRASSRPVLARRPDARH